MKRAMLIVVEILLVGLPLLATAAFTPGCFGTGGGEIAPSDSQVSFDQWVGRYTTINQ